MIVKNNETLTGRAKMHRIQKAQNIGGRPKNTASLLRMERTFKETDLDKVKLKQNFDDGSSKTQEVPIYDGGGSGLEGLLYCAEKFTDAAAALVFDTGDELFENYGSTLACGARDTWLTVLSDANLGNNMGTEEQFNECFSSFLLSYSNDKAKNDVRKYLLDDKNPELEKDHDSDVHQHGMRYRTLCRYSRMLHGTCADISESEEKEGLLTCFPEEWQNSYNLRRDVANDGFAEILTFMKREKNEADSVYRLMLEGISSADLRESGLTIPIEQLLSNKLQNGQTPQPKRQRNFSLLLQLGDFKAAMAELLNAASDHIAETPVDPKKNRWPVIQSYHTWNRSNVRDQLREKRELLRNRLMTYTPEDRQQVVIGIRLGTGFGKTHLLTDAPDLLAAQGLYVTYNNYQGLSADKKDPVKTILIRLLLASNNCESTECDRFLTSGKSAGMMEASSHALRDLLLYHLKSAWGQNYPDIVIGVDELMDLGVEESKRVVKELAEVSARYLSETKSMCTVLVSSLNTAPFSTKSGRPVEEWAPDRPDKGTLEYFAHSLASEDRQRAMALVNAVSGGHIRSMVLAFDLFRQNKVNASVQWLYNRMSTRMGARLGQNTCSCIQDYVKECISSSGSPKIEPEVEEISDSIGAVPPVFLMMAYKGTSSEMHLENMIHAFSLFEKDGKHLELVSKYYDLFRATLGLPVVPGKTMVHIPLNGNNQKTATWYEKLEFSRNMSENQAALLKQKQTSSKGKTKTTVVATEEVPKFGNYYHPKIGNHPWIDRVYVAQHPCSSDPYCLVLVQDKVNESGFADACRKLEEAANSLTKKAGYPKNALLIVNVIGSGYGTRAQSSLTWPSILIRGLDEVRQFYSVNFADMVWFARERHLLSE